MNQSEFEALLSDDSKRIDEDIRWSEDEDHSPAVEFRAEVASSAGHPLFVRGSFNRLARSMSLALIHRSHGRLYALDLGTAHHNPTCDHVGSPHKHRWNEPLRDKEAYEPPDITAGIDDPVGVWRQFCAEAKLTHGGSLEQPPPIQLEFL